MRSTKPFDGKPRRRQHKPPPPRAPQTTATTGRKGGPAPPPPPSRPLHAPPRGSLGQNSSSLSPPPRHTHSPAPPSPYPETYAGVRTAVGQPLRGLAARRIRPPPKPTRSPSGTRPAKGAPPPKQRASPAWQPRPRQGQPATSASRQADANGKQAQAHKASVAPCLPRGRLNRARGSSRKRGGARTA